MTSCPATFECVGTTQTDVSMVSSALQERFLAGFGQGSGVMTHDSALGTSVMKVPALDRQLRFGAPDCVINPSFHFDGGAGGWM
jgi:hypothetical protein